MVNTILILYIHIYSRFLFGTQRAAAGPDNNNEQHNVIFENEMTKTVETVGVFGCFQGLDYTLYFPSMQRPVASSPVES